MRQFNVTGMSCAACQARVEKAVSAVTGVDSCSVSLLTNSMGVEGSASEADIINAVEAAGYGASIKNKTGNTANIDNSQESLIDRETPVLIKRLVASVILLLPLMYVSMGHMMWEWPLPGFLDGNHVAMGIYELLISGIIMVINQKFFISGFRGLIHRSPNMDTLVALIAGFIVVPACFATLGADGIGKGASFAFVSLAGVFQQMPAGWLFGAAFYLLLLFAALTSCISLLEVIISFLTEKFGFDRKKSTIGLTVVLFLLGILYTISQASVDMHLPWLDFTGISSPIVGDWMEFLTDRLLLPVCALGECIFVGWVWKPENVIRESCAEGNTFSWAGLYSFCVKFVAPLGIALILIYSFATGTTVS